jgi:hypothetical protein
MSCRINRVTLRKRKTTPTTYEALVPQGWLFIGIEVQAATYREAKQLVQQEATRLYNHTKLEFAK